MDKSTWWILKTEDGSELTEPERQYIADLIVNGYTSGELVRTAEEQKQ